MIGEVARKSLHNLLRDLDSTRVLQRLTELPATLRAPNAVVSSRLSATDDIITRNREAIGLVSFCLAHGAPDDHLFSSLGILLNVS